MTGTPGSNVVMAIDDSKTMRDMVSFTVKRMGYTVMTACDGQEAFDVLKTDKIALIITDWNMPVMDGITLLAKVKAETVNKSTPVLMVTTESDKEKVIRAKELGATGWIVKPFSPEKLEKVIKKVLG